MRFELIWRGTKRQNIRAPRCFFKTERDHAYWGTRFGSYPPDRVSKYWKLSSFKVESQETEQRIALLLLLGYRERRLSPCAYIKSLSERERTWDLELVI